MARHQNKLKNLGKCKYAFKQQRKQIELMQELSIKAQDTLFGLSCDTKFYTMGKIRVFATYYLEHKVSILIDNETISFDLGNKTAFSKALDKCTNKDFEEFVKKVKELYL